MTMKNKALIFDLDGTLWNACLTIAQAWTSVKNQYSVEQQDITKADVEGICGLTTDKVFKQIFPNDYQNDQLIDDCWSLQNQLLKERGGELYPNLKETLDKLKDNHDLYIVSNCGLDYIETFIGVHQLEGIFMDWACYGDELKPKSYNIKKLMDRNSIEDAYYIGDTKGDQEAARANQLDFIYCSYGLGVVEDADFVINDFSEILDVVKKWKLIERRTIIENEWIAIYDQEVQLPNGHLIKNYYTLSIGDWCGVVAITPDKEIVMIKQYRYAQDSVFYELPCGMIDDGEEPILSAKREMEEETGYSTEEDLVYLGKTSASPAKISSLAYCYLARNAYLKMEQHLHETEDIEVVLVPISEVKQLIKKGLILDSFIISNIYMALDIIGNKLS